MNTDYFIPVKPKACPRPRVTRNGRAYMDSNYKAWKLDVSKFLAEKKQYFYDRAIRVEMDFCLIKPKSSKNEHPTVRPDVDNYVKSVLDAMNGIIISDDSIVTSLEASKKYSSIEGIALRIYPIH